MQRKENIYDRQYRNAEKQFCREIFGTDDAAELREIARKAEKYDLILQTARPGNIRGAGRKAKFTEQELREIYRLYTEGAGVSKLSARFGVSRQTIYKYLAARPQEEGERPTLRINFMEEYTVCSVIDVDETKRSVSVTNRVTDYSRCAFGAMEQPDWESFEHFLEQRCFPRDTEGAEECLRELGLSSYEPLKILEKTKGRLAKDRHWLQIIYFDRDDASENTRSKKGKTK